MSPSILGDAVIAEGWTLLIVTVGSGLVGGFVVLFGQASLFRAMTHDKRLVVHVPRDPGIPPRLKKEKR